MFKCVKFTLLNVKKDVLVGDIIQEIKKNFSFKENCRINSQSLTKRKNDLTLVIEVFGNERVIQNAIKNSETTFQTLCENLNTSNWLV